MIAEIEKAVLARLDAAGKAELLGYRFANQGNYPRDWEGRLLSSEVRYPASWCNFARFATTDTLRSGAQVEAIFEVVLASQNSRDNKSYARQGGVGAAEPGSIQLMEDAIGLLEGQKLGLDIGELKVSGGEITGDLPDAVVKAGVSLAVLQFRTKFIFQRATPYFSERGEFIGDLETFHVDWARPAGQAPGGDDAPAQIDLTTQKTLPTEEEA